MSRDALGVRRQPPSPASPGTPAPCGTETNPILYSIVSSIVCDLMCLTVTQPTDAWGGDSAMLRPRMRRSLRRGNSTGGGCRYPPRKCSLHSLQGDYAAKTEPLSKRHEILPPAVHPVICGGVCTRCTPLHHFPAQTPPPLRSIFRRTTVALCHTHAPLSRLLPALKMCVSENGNNLNEYRLCHSWTRMLSLKLHSWSNGIETYTPTYK